MSMPVRSNRAISFELGRTPAKVGPGRYTQKDRGVVPSYAAFQSTNARILNGNTGTSAITPGPGTYIGDGEPPSKSRSGQAVSTAFRSTVARIGPTGAGATPFQEPTSFANPGPGHYTSELLGSSMPLRKLAGVTGGKAPLVAPARKAPSVPRPNQCYGYEPGPNGELVAQGAPPDVYTGMSNDTVGPAFYDPKLPDTKGTINFARGSKRDTGFGSEAGGKTPGPGHYDSTVLASGDLESASLLSQLRRGVLAKTRSKRSTRSAPTGYQRQRQLESAVFKSKTPMVHNRKQPESDQPGPGAYAVSGRRASKSRGMHGFGSTVAREGWARNPSMPYVDPDTVETPGPGAYGGKKMRKTLSALSLQEDTPHVPFQSTDERPCLRNQGRSGTAPGPGSYDAHGGRLNLLVTSLHQRTHGRPGNFGSDTRRDFSTNPRGTVAQTPGPGYYDAADKKHAGGGSRRPQAGAVFRSTTNRFRGGMKSNDVQIVGPQLVPPPTKYNAHKAWGGGSASRRARRSKGPAFATRSQRFAPQRSTMDTPGPGAYDSVSAPPTRGALGFGSGSLMDNGRLSAMSVANSSLGSTGGSRMWTAGPRSHSSFGSRQNRFHTDVHNYLGNDRLTPKTVGPGRYNVSGSFVKKSFNITMGPGAVQY